MIVDIFHLAFSTDFESAGGKQSLKFTAIEWIVTL